MRGWGRCRLSCSLARTQSADRCGGGAGARQARILGLSAGRLRVRGGGEAAGACGWGGVSCLLAPGWLRAARGRGRSRRGQRGGAPSAWASVEKGAGRPLRQGAVGPARTWSSYPQVPATRVRRQGDVPGGVRPQRPASRNGTLPGHSNRRTEDGHPPARPRPTTHPQALHDDEPPPRRHQPPHTRSRHATTNPRPDQRPSAASSFAASVRSFAVSMARQYAPCGIGNPDRRRSRAR